MEVSGGAADAETYLRSTATIDSDSEPVRRQARALTEGLDSDRDKAVALFYYVRDQIRHNPYAPGLVLEDYRASAILERGNGYCQHKAILLVALCRAAEIPARLGFVDALFTATSAVCVTGLIVVDTAN